MANFKYTINKDNIGNVGDRLIFNLNDNHEIYAQIVKVGKDRVSLLVIDERYHDSMIGRVINVGFDE